MWASSQAHRMCQGRSKGNTRVFSSQRTSGFFKRAITDRKEPRHKVLLLFFSFRMPHSKFPKAPASLCINCKTPVAAFWDDLHWLLENCWRGFERGICSPCSFCANYRSGLAHRRTLWAGCGCVFGTRATYIILSNPAPLPLPVTSMPYPAPPAMPACCLCSTWRMRPENSSR